MHTRTERVIPYLINIKIYTEIVKYVLLSDYHHHTIQMIHPILILPILILPILILPVLILPILILYYDKTVQDSQKSTKRVFGILR